VGTLEKDSDESYMKTTNYSSTSIHVWIDVYFSDPEHTSMCLLGIWFNLIEALLNWDLPRKPKG
jgi:hypothetical protein